MEERIEEESNAVPTQTETHWPSEIPTPPRNFGFQVSQEKFRSYFGSGLEAAKAGKGSRKNSRGTYAVNYRPDFLAPIRRHNPICRLAFGVEKFRVYWDLNKERKRTHYGSAKLSCQAKECSVSYQITIVEKPSDETRAVEVEVKQVSGDVKAGHPRTADGKPVHTFRDQLNGPSRHDVKRDMKERGLGPKEYARARMKAALDQPESRQAILAGNYSAAPTAPQLEKVYQELRNKDRLHKDEHKDLMLWKERLDAKHKTKYEESRIPIPDGFRFGNVKGIGVIPRTTTLFLDEALDLSAELVKKGGKTIFSFGGSSGLVQKLKDKPDTHVYAAFIRSETHPELNLEGSSMEFLTDTHETTTIHNGLHEFVYRLWKKVDPYEDSPDPLFFAAITDNYLTLLDALSNIITWHDIRSYINHCWRALYDKVDMISLPSYMRLPNIILLACTRHSISLIPVPLARNSGQRRRNRIIRLLVSRLFHVKTLDQLWQTVTNLTIVLVSKKETRAVLQAREWVQGSFELAKDIESVVDELEKAEEEVEKTGDQLSAATSSFPDDNEEESIKERLKAQSPFTEPFRRAAERGRQIAAQADSAHPSAILNSLQCEAIAEWLVDNMAMITPLWAHFLMQVHLQVDEPKLYFNSAPEEHFQSLKANWMKTPSGIACPGGLRKGAFAAQHYERQSRALTALKTQEQSIEDLMAVVSKTRRPYKRRVPASTAVSESYAHPVDGEGAGDTEEEEV